MDGSFMHCRHAAVLLSTNPDLLGELVGNYVHPDDSDTFIRELHESSASGNALRFFYRFMKEDGT